MVGSSNAQNTWEAELKNAEVKTTPLALADGVGTWRWGSAETILRGCAAHISAQFTAAKILQNDALIATGAPIPACNYANGLLWSVDEGKVFSVVEINSSGEVRLIWLGSTQANKRYLICADYICIPED